MDVAARLAQGQATVDAIGEYLWACHLLGWHHPDLTRYRHQAHDWYAAEDGLNLHVLDAECTAMAAAADAVQHEYRLQDSHFRRMAWAWQGAGARASTDLLARHATASDRVANGMHSAATILVRLRDALWQAVNARVLATQRVETGDAAQRGVWLAAARTVSGGVGDRSTASELVDQQVTPFVAGEIAGEWLAAMRRATDAVAAAYAEAIAALRALPPPVFGTPGPLGSVCAPSQVGGRAEPSASGWAAGPAAGWSAPQASSPGVPAPAAVPAPAPDGPPPPAPGLAPPPPPAPAAEVGPGFGEGLGGGLSGLGGGGLPSLGGIGSALTGTGQSLADLLGGLIDSAAADLGDPLFDGASAGHDEGFDAVEVGDGDDRAADDITDPEDPEDPDGTDEDEDPEGLEDAAEGEAAEPVVEPDVVDAEPFAPEGDSPAPVPVVPPAPVAAPVTAPVAEPLDASAGETPCEIAAEELPQAGP